jgi:hypothetical protein
MSAAEKVLLEVGKRCNKKPEKIQPLLEVLRKEWLIAADDDDDQDDLQLLLKYMNDGNIRKVLEDLRFPMAYVRELEEKLRQLGLQVVPYNGGDRADARPDEEARVRAAAEAQARADEKRA